MESPGAERPSGELHRMDRGNRAQAFPKSPRLSIGLSPQQLDVLISLVEAYEVRHRPFVTARPVEAIPLQMEQAGLQPGDPRHTADISSPPPGPSATLFLRHCSHLTVCSEHATG
ncbi:MAG: hypothetical protein KDI74_14175 [Gammaproteobacteria bacterium]|nr:hypothetical protein [Gammaproteobacteria bacterium]